MATQKTASFLTPGLQPPYAAEMAQATQEQQLLAQQLQELAQQKGPQPINAGKFAALNFEGVGNALTEALTKKKMEASRKKVADVQGSYQKELLRELSKYSGERDGSTEVVAGPPEESGMPATKTTPGNPLAFRRAEQSPFPEVRGAAEDDRKTYEALLKEAAGKASLRSLQGANGDIRQLRAKGDVKFENGAAFDMPDEAGQAPTLVPGLGVTQENVPGLGVSNRLPGGKLDPLDKRTQVNMPGQKAGTKFLETEAESLSKRREALETTAPGQFRALASAEQAAAQGALQGPVSGVLQSAAGILREFGMAPEATQGLLKNTEVLNSDMGRFVLGALKATGTNPSNADREYAERTAGGQKLSPEGLQSVIRAARADILNNLITHNKHVDRLAPNIPEVEMARLQLPTISNATKGAKGVPPNAIDVQGYLPDTETGMLMPHARPGPNAKSSGYTPAQLEKMRKYGYTPQGH